MWGYSSRSGRADREGGRSAARKSGGSQSSFSESHQLGNNVSSAAAALRALGSCSAASVPPPGVWSNERHGERVLEEPPRRRRLARRTRTARDQDPGLRKQTDSSDAKRITDFVDGAVAGTSSGSSEHDDKESFRLGIFLHSVSMAMGMPVKDLLNQPLVDITSASPSSSSSSTTPAEAPSFCRTIRPRKFRFRRQQQKPCSRCKVVLEVKNANKIVAFGKEVLIRRQLSSLHAHMSES